MLIETLANLGGVIEAYIILGVTFGVYGWSYAYLVEWMNRVVNTVFAFVPLRVGIDEGSTALTVKSFGFASAAGVSLAIIRKVRGFPLAQAFTPGLMSGELLRPIYGAFANTFRQETWLKQLCQSLLKEAC